MHKQQKESVWPLHSSQSQYKVDCSTSPWAYDWIKSSSVPTSPLQGNIQWAHGRRIQSTLGSKLLYVYSQTLPEQKKLDCIEKSYKASNTSFSWKSTWCTWNPRWLLSQSLRLEQQRTTRNRTRRKGLLVYSRQHQRTHPKRRWVYLLFVV